MLPTGFRAFHFVSFLYGFFSFLFFFFCFFSFLTILFSFFCVSFFFSFLFVTFLLVFVSFFFSFCFFSFLFVFSVSQLTGTQIQKNYFRWIENNTQLRYIVKFSSILIPLKYGVWHMSNVANFARKWLLLSTLLVMAKEEILTSFIVFSDLRHKNESDHAKNFVT